MTTELRRYSELTSGFQLPTVRVKAVNTAVGSGIHDDAQAAKYGYRGGLVPGPTVYSYVNRVLQDYLGSAWLASGQMTINFAKPFYDGEDATAGAVVTERNDDAIIFEVWAENAEGVRCARGSATFPLVDGEAPPESLPYIVTMEDIANNPDWPRGELPVGIPYTPYQITVDAERSLGFAQKAGDDDAIYGLLVHPAVFISGSIRMRVERPKRDEAPPPPPVEGEAKRPRSVGMHVGSEITSFLPARVGQTYTLYGTYTNSYVRNDSDWGTSEIVACDEEGRCVFRTRNSFIFRLAPKK
ncbi:MAG: hypothetical protein AB7R89_21935 [Dehalococcoidia bacterium]